MMASTALMMMNWKVMGFFSFGSTAMSPFSQVLSPGFSCFQPYWLNWWPGWDSSFLVDFYDMYVVPWNGLLQPTPGFTTALEVLCRVAVTAISR